MKLARYEQPLFNHNLTPPIENFFSRGKELEELHDKLTKSGGGRRKNESPKLGAVLCGCPGVGKSETARKYWFKYGRSYTDTVLWVDAENAATLESEFQVIADECGIKKTKDKRYVGAKKLVDLVYRHFAVTRETDSTRKVLFVFDGADDLDIAKRFLPQCIDYAPCFLVTSQCTNWGSQFHHIEIDVFDTDDALQFFIDNTPSSEQYRNTEEITGLLTEISCHPLALQQAVSYIIKNGSTIKEYMSLLDSARKRDLLSQKVDPLSYSSVNSTMMVSIDRLKGINSKAVDLLSIMAHLDGMEIKKGLLMMFVDNDTYILNEILTLFRTYAIVNYPDVDYDVPFKDRCIRIHSLTQHFLASTQSNELITDLLREITDVFIKDLKRCEKTPDKPQDGRYWLNHFDKLCGDEDKKSTMLNKFVEVGQQYQLRNLLITKGRNEDLVDISQFICEQQKRIHGEESHVYLKTKYQLARALYKFDKIDAAVKMLDDTIASQLRLQNNDELDFHVIKSKIILAECLLRNGNSNGNTVNRERAYKLNNEVKDALIATNKTEHFLYLKILNNIAFNYVCIEEFETALESFKSLKQMNFKLTEDRIGSSTSVRYSIIDNDIGYCYLRLKRYEEAIQAFQGVTEKKLKCLGPDHYEYLKYKGRLAMSYQGNKEYEKANQLFIDVVSALLKTTGPTNQNYIMFKKSHDMCLKEMQELGEASHQKK